MSEVRREGYKFCQELDIPCYDTDASFHLKPSAFMDLAQEIAYWAAQMLGFGYDDLQIHHTAWVLSRMHFHVESSPRWRDRVTLYTWHKGPDGPFFLRDFILADAEGATALACTSSWVVIDDRTRRMARPEELQDLLSAEPGVDHAIADPAPKVVLPRGVELEEAGEHVVSYSDVDILGHTNNARYMVWAMDALPYEWVSSRQVRDVYINFNRETTPGTTVRLSRLLTQEAGVPVGYVEGCVDGKPAFCTKIVFSL